MSVRSSSDASSSSELLTVIPTSAMATRAPLNVISDNSPDSCTYVKQQDVKNAYGCYLFRSCQSCLETSGCLINDLGICVSLDGLTNLATGAVQTATAYVEQLNYLHALEQNLSLPEARFTNTYALAAEQNWHFSAGQATYCKPNDAVCADCTANNFWRGSTSEASAALSDSRFCVGESGCVCIQTCEVPSFRPPGCQWKLDPPVLTPTPTSYNAGEYSPTSGLTFWDWLVVSLMIVVPHVVFRCFSQTETRQRKAAREEAERAVYCQMGNACAHP